MTTQAWSFMPRVRELGEELVEFPDAHGAADDSASGVRESHREICFSKLTDRDVSESKPVGRCR